MCVCEFGPRVQRVWPTIVSSFEVATWLKDVEEEQWITDSSIRAVFFFLPLLLFIAKGMSYVESNLENMI